MFIESFQLRNRVRLRARGTEIRPQPGFSLLNECFPPSLLISSPVQWRKGQHPWVCEHTCRFCHVIYFLKWVEMNYTLKLAQLNRGVAAYVTAALELICLLYLVAPGVWGWHCVIFCCRSSDFTHTLGHLCRTVVLKLKSRAPSPSCLLLAHISGDAVCVRCEITKPAPLLSWNNGSPLFIQQHQWGAGRAFRGGNLTLLSFLGISSVCRFDHWPLLDNC